MKKESKIAWLYLGAEVFWWIGTVLALPAVPFNKLGDALKRRAHFLGWGELI